MGTIFTQQRRKRVLQSPVSQRDLFHPHPLTHSSCHLNPLQHPIPTPTSPAHSRSSAGPSLNLRSLPCPPQQTSNMHFPLDRVFFLSEFTLASSAHMRHATLTVQCGFTSPHRHAALTVHLQSWSTYMTRCTTSGLQAQ
jgi:hypothetical protein